jgi:dTDP-4-amino-4,6-dideoxygalactose transaminase
MTPVTKSFLPNIDDYIFHINRIFNNEWLTNRGELVLELEQKLIEYLNVSNILITNNGTIPLQIALKLFGNGGEIITTPFSYIATTSSIVWENCKPIFVDIDPEHLTIDESLIESAITPKTTCILATHVFGNPCNIESISKIAKKHNLKIIYDGAHCFGVKYMGRSIFEYGDISTCSFHATKLFHTGEGGAIFCENKEIRKKIFYSHNFGHDGPLNFHGLGINGKISELHAAMGLAVLPNMDNILKIRRNIVDNYVEILSESNLKFMKLRADTEWNFSYFPVIFENENSMQNVLKSLNNEQIFPRQYFAPSLNTVNYLHNKQEMKISESISNRILCLPLYHSLTDSNVVKISRIILNNC